MPLCQTTKILPTKFITLMIECTVQGRVVHFVTKNITPYTIHTLLYCTNIINTLYVSTINALDLPLTTLYKALTRW